MKTRLVLSGLALAGGLVLSTPALAHLGAAAHGGFLAGFAHPLGGLDHLLAMVAVGLWAAQLGGRALWMLPTAFVGSMALGAHSVALLPEIAAVELAIAASVLVLGVAVALRLRLSAGLAAVAVVPFALAHGHAHGTEMLPGSEAGLYGLGFVLATALLHGAGIVVIQGLNRLQAPAILARAGGGAIAATGAFFLIGGLI